jgi:hypothetical protein
LRYNLALKYSVFTANQQNQGVTINITAIKDTQFGDFTPTVNDLRSVTFYVTDSSKARIYIRDEGVGESEIQRNPADETGNQNIGIKWFEPDYTDYTNLETR